MTNQIITHGEMESESRINGGWIITPGEVIEASEADERPIESKRDQIKYSKNGWPLSATEHKIGSGMMTEGYARTLCRELESLFGIKIKLTRPLDDEPHFFDLTTEPVRLSMERYNCMTYFVKGFIRGMRS